MKALKDHQAVITGQEASGYGRFLLLDIKIGHPSVWISLYSFPAAPHALQRQVYLST